MIATAAERRHMATLLELRERLQANATRIVPITLEPDFAREVLGALEKLDLDTIVDSSVRVNLGELREAIEDAVSSHADEIAQSVIHELKVTRQMTA